jgi:hypothetical protein
MKRLFLILVVMAFAVSSAVAKGEEKEKAPKCTITLADGKTVSGYWIDIKIKARPVGANNANVVLTMTIADTPDAKKGTDYSADNAVRFVAWEGKDSVEYLSLYGQKPMTKPINLKASKYKSFWLVGYKKNGIIGFKGTEIQVFPGKNALTGHAEFNNSSQSACFYCLEGENVVVPYWSSTEAVSIGAKNTLRYSFERFPKVVEYVNKKEFKMKMINEDPIGFLDKVVELKK